MNRASAWMAVFLLVLPVLWPRVDIGISGFFYHAGQGFFLANNPGFFALHWLAVVGARVLGVVLAVAAGVAMARRRMVGGLDAKAWLFLFMALLIGPGLVANTGFKDHWGRARPREIVEFGGSEKFTPFYQPHFENARRNGSFVSGDGAFGFFLPVFAFVAVRSRARRVFWTMMLAGALFGFTRIVMGGHFFSDVVYAGFFMLLTISALHAAMYGRKETAARWREILKAS